MFIPHFAGKSIDTIKKTFNAIAQYLRTKMSTILTKYFRSPFPVLNIPRRQESVAPDTIYTDTPVIDCGNTRAQFYCGTDSQVCDVYGIKTDNKIINSFEDIIRQSGSMDRLISDQAQI